MDHLSPRVDGHLDGQLKPHELECGSRTRGETRFRCFLQNVRAESKIVLERKKVAHVSKDGADGPNIEIYLNLNL
jgi:hypothetical protein